MSALISSIVALIVSTLAIFGIGTNTQSAPTQPWQASTSVTATENGAFSATPISGPVPLTVTFTNFPSTAAEEDLQFGDGKEASNGYSGNWPAAGVVHTYTNPGTYTATLMGSMSNGVLGQVTITVTGSNADTSDISVPGMTKYTDPDFGFSFWYPSGSAITETNLQGYGGYGSYGSTAKVIKTLKTPAFTLEEVYSSDSSIYYQESAGPFGSDIDHYYFDNQTHTWMDQNDGGPKGEAGGTSPADVSQNTMGGLHILRAYERFGYRAIVPLSAHHFLVLSALCNDATDRTCSGGLDNQDVKSFNAAVKTITAIDPSVATPVSADEQIKVVQAEKDAYAKQ